MEQQTLYLVRHAESTMSGKYCGSTDAALSEAGRGEAGKLTGFFRNIPIQSCYVSDLKRTRQTLRRFFRSQTIPIKTPQLREIHFGEWEAQSYETVSKRWPETYSRWLRSPARTTIPSGEPFPAFRARLKSFSKNILKDAAENILVVGHAGSLSVLSLILLEEPVKNFWKRLPSPASITILKRNLNGKAGPFKLERMGDRSHLQ